MRIPALLTAAMLAAVPVAAWADDGPPVQLVNVSDPHDGVVDVQVWIAYGFGKQLLIDNDWDDEFGINHANAAKFQTDVVVRFRSEWCNDADSWASLVTMLQNDWYALETATDDHLPLPVFFHEIQAGWLWEVSVPLTECACGTTTIDYHCSNGSVHTTCSSDACDRLGDVTVQAYNRPDNEKCETDLTGDGANECDAGPVMNVGDYGATPGGAATNVTFTGGDWTRSCDETNYEANDCVATCVARNSNGTTTTITCGYEGVVAVSPSNTQCNNTCQEIDMAPYCLFPADQQHGQPAGNTPGGGGNGGGNGNPHNARLLKVNPAQLHAPTLKAAKRQAPRFDATLRPRKPIR